MSIKTNSITAYDITTYFELLWTSTQNINDNLSLLNLQLITRQDPAGSGYQRSIVPNGSKVVVNRVTYNISEQKAWDSKVIWSIENISIPHNPDGTNSINASVQVNVGGTFVSGSGSIVLPTIQRTSQVSVSPRVLSSGNANISVTKYVDTYTTTIKYTVRGTEYTLATKSTATSFSLSYTALKNIIGGYTTAEVLVKATTFNGDIELGTSTASFLIQTGKVPMYLYDDMQGNVGVTFGEKATGKDVNFKLPTNFYENATFDTEKGIFLKDSNNVNREAIKMDANDDLIIGEGIKASGKRVFVKGKEVGFVNEKNNNVTFNSGNANHGGFLLPNVDTIALGIVANPWYRLNAKNPTQVVSDERDKKYINDLDVKYENLFHNLNPKRFKMRKDDDTWRIGFIAQNVEQAVNEAGLANMGVVDHVYFLDENGNEKDKYNLAYTEFIALNTYMLQKAYEKIDELENKVKSLEEVINAG